MNVRNLANLLIVFLVAAFVFSTNAFAQQDAAKLTENIIQTTDKIENLRAQVEEIETKKANLQERIRQLDEAMLPENLERTTVIAGSTRPEEIRENRRCQLEIEKKSAQSQIDLLEQNRLRIELSIATTEPKAAPPESASTKTQNSDEAAQTETQKITDSESGTITQPAAKTVKRYPTKNKRRRN